MAQQQGEPGSGSAKRAVFSAHKGVATTLAAAAGFVDIGWGASDTIGEKLNVTHSTTVNNERVTCSAGYAGKYAVAFKWGLDGNPAGATTSLQGQITQYNSGGSVVDSVAQWQSDADANASDGRFGSLYGEFDLSDGDYLIAACRSQGTDNDLSGSYFVGLRVRRIPE